MSDEGERFALHLCLVDADRRSWPLGHLVEVRDVPRDGETASLEDRIAPIRLTSDSRFRVGRSAPKGSLPIEALEVSTYPSRGQLDMSVAPVDLLVCSNCQGWTVSKAGTPADDTYDISPPDLAAGSVVVFTAFTFDNVGIIMKSWAVEVE